MSVENIFRRIVGALEASGIPYMLTGSFASAHHGTPRSTQDIDLVIAPTAPQLRALLRLLPDTEYYVSEESALTAFHRREQFNVLDLATGWKVDLILRKERAFSRSEFSRRETVELMGIPLVIATAEDVLLAKLEWAKIGGSERQLEDAAGIVSARGAELDRRYIERWTAELGIDSQWEKVLGMLE